MERQSLEEAIAALEAQRSTLGDELIEAALAPLRQRLARLLDEGCSAPNGEMGDLWAPLVGRQREMARLQELFQTLVDEGKSHMLVVLGVGGIGKARLVQEFHGWLEDRSTEIHLFQGRASSEMRHVPYGLLRRIMSHRFQIDDQDSAALVREKIERGIAAPLSEEGIQGDGLLAPLSASPLYLRTHFLGRLLGFDFRDDEFFEEERVDPQEVRDRARGYLADYLRAAARQKPVVMRLIDLHWADDSTLDVLQYLLRSVPDLPLLILCTAQPLLVDRRPQWFGPLLEATSGPSTTAEAAELESASCLELGSLDRADGERLAAELLRPLSPLPQALVEMIVGRAEGRPLHLEEVTRLLLEEGVVIRGDDGWRIEADRLVTVRIPSALGGVLQARLASLAPPVQTVLQRAAVLGFAFAHDALAYLGQQEDLEPSLEACLALLQERGMIRPRQTLAGRRVYVFKHPLLRSAAYEMIPVSQRRKTHARVASRLSQQSAEQGLVYAGLVAYHLEQAGETEGALDCLIEAGRQAEARFAHVEAINYLSRALELVPPSDVERRYALLLAREQVYDVKGDRQSQEQDLEALKELAAAVEDGCRQAAVALRWANYAQLTGEYGAAAAAGRRAIALAEACGDRIRASQGHLDVGQALWRKGEGLEAYRELRRALALAQETQQVELEADALRALGNLSLSEGDYALAHRYYLHALQIHREREDRRGECRVLNNLGALAYHEDDYVAARDHYGEALGICSEIGDRRVAGAVLVNLGVAVSELGSYSTALSYYEQALAIGRQVGNRWGESLALGNTGIIYHRLGRYEEARSYYTQALRIHIEIGDRQGEARLRSRLSLLFHHLGDSPSARRYSEQSMEIARELGDPHLQGYGWLYLGHVLTALSQPEEAADAYRQGLEIRRQLEQHNLAMEPLAGLAELALLGDDLPQAQRCVAEILERIEANETLDGSEEPFRVYLTCYRVLSAADDPRAAALLEQGRRLLQERADRIEEPELRRSFLEEVAVHRELMAL